MVTLLERLRDMAVNTIRVLVVDDSTVARDGLSAILRAHSDLDVVGEAASGWEAIEQAERLRPGVVVMDAQMPEMDGVEATRLIKERLPQTKVLFLSVHVNHIDAALEAGADAQLMKDCSRQVLLDAVRRLGRMAADQS